MKDKYAGWVNWPSPKALTWMHILSLLRRSDLPLSARTIHCCLAVSTASQYFPAMVRDGVIRRSGRPFRYVITAKGRAQLRKLKAGAA